MKPQIIVDVSLGGSAEVNVEGAQGPQCTQMTEKLLKELGGHHDTELKPEFHKKQHKQQSQGQ